MRTSPFLLAHPSIDLSLFCSALLCSVPHVTIHIHIFSLHRAEQAEQGSSVGVLARYDYDSLIDRACSRMYVYWRSERGGGPEKNSKAELATSVLRGNEVSLLHRGIYSWHIYPFSSHLCFSFDVSPSR